MFRDGGSVNLAMVSSGQAFAYRKYLSACDGSAYLGAEAAAQRQRVGVWAVPGGIQRPWDWRKGTRPSAAYTAAPFPPPAPQQQAPPPAAPAAQSPAPFVSPEEMSLSGPPPGASSPSRLNPPSPPVEPPVNKQVADALNSADQRNERGRDGCSSVRWAITFANNEPTPTAQRAEVKRYADRYKLRYQP